MLLNQCTSSCARDFYRTRIERRRSSIPELQISLCAAGASRPRPGFGRRDAVRGSVQISVVHSPAAAVPPPPPRRRAAYLRHGLPPRRVGTSRGLWWKRSLWSARWRRRARRGGSRWQRGRRRPAGLPARPARRPLPPGRGAAAAAGSSGARRAQVMRSAQAAGRPPRAVDGGAVDDGRRAGGGWRPRPRCGPRR